MHQTDSLREFVREILIKERKNGSKWVSLDILQERVERNFEGSYRDLRGSLIKMLNRHTPGGQHQGDGYNAVDTFRKKKDDNGRLYYSLLVNAELGIWKKFT